MWYLVADSAVEDVTIGFMKNGSAIGLIGGQANDGRMPRDDCAANG